MEEIIAYLTEKYRPLAMITYGSYTDGSNNEHSDFDALLIADCHEKYHDTSMQNGVRLDVFIYPSAVFQENYDCGEFMQIFDGNIVMDTDERAAKLMEHVREYIAAQPGKTKEEIADELAWCRKMLLRAKRQDAEGMFRLHWLLVDSLEIFCDAMQILYLGPKKSLNWMSAHCPEAFDCYSKALTDYSLDASWQWIDWIEDHCV